MQTTTVTSEPPPAARLSGAVGIEPARDHTPLRLVWFSHSGILSGSELGLLQAASELARCGVSVHVVVPEYDSLARELESAGIGVSNVPYRWWMSDSDSVKSRWGNAVALLDVRVLRRLTKLLRRVDPDIVMTNTSTIAAGAIAAKVLGLPHVWYVREFGYDDHNLRFDVGSHLGFHLIKLLSDAVVVNSRSLVAHLASVGLVDKVRLVRYAVETPAFLPVSRGESTRFRLAQIGRLQPRKGQEDAIRALSILARDGLDVGLELVGSEVASYGKFLRNLARELGVADRVEFRQFTNDPFSVLASADVALMCSRREAFGRVTIEAMKVGTPVIGSRSGETADLIRDGWSGLLYTPGSAEDLARKIESLYRDRTLLAEMGANASAWSSRNFTFDDYSADLLQVFDDVLRARRDGQVHGNESRARGQDQHPAPLL